jgi:hypothetical protein
MPNTEKIRELNDQFRTSFKGGQVMMTRGIAGRPDCNDILEGVRRFDAFTNDNDPYGEHDFGAFEAGKDTIYFKLDYYAKDLASGSPDPADPNVTTRVMTIMLAQEY